MTDNLKETDYYIIQRRIDMDLLDRSIPGIILYSLLWPLLFFPFDLHIEEPMLCWGIAIIMASLSLLRFTHKLFSEALYDKSRSNWRLIFSVLSLSQAALWSFIFTLSIIDIRLEPISNLITLALSGLAAGATFALTPRLWLARTNVAFLLVPAAIVSVFSDSHFSLLVLIVMYIFYLASLGKRSNSEYLRAYEIELQLKQQQRELERVNKIDPLTNIYNRGYFNTALDIQWNNAIRAQHKITLLFIDIDHFKSINDQYGHLVGDQSITQIANLIDQTAKRTNDLVARFGGEEFAVLLNDSSLEAGIEIAENIRKKTEGSLFHSADLKLKITISVGVACLLPKLGMNSNLLIESADKSLYIAKNEGRNCVRFNDESNQNSIMNKSHQTTKN